jgi:hypothetical protein
MNAGESMRRMPTSGPRTRSDAHLDMDGCAPQRERLLQAAVAAGLQPTSVYDLAVALTGCTWERTGPREIRTIAWEMLGAANRAAHYPSAGGHGCNE